MVGTMNAPVIFSRAMIFSTPSGLEVLVQDHRAADQVLKRHERRRRRVIQRTDRPRAADRRG